MPQASQAGRGHPAPSSPTGVLRRLHGDRSGAVAMMFGLAVIPLVAIVGLAIDFGRSYSVMSHTQAALDAAALAAGRVAQVEKTDMLTKASNTATAYFNQAKPADVVTTSLQFTSSTDQTKFTVVATSWVRTPFLGVLNLLMHQGSESGAPTACQGNRYACVRMTATSTAELKVGGNGQTNLEIAMMLDITGSMGGQKLTDMKSAASDLIDIVIWADQSEFTSKVALAPFSQAVNAGSYFTAVTGLSDGYIYPSSCYRSNGTLKSSCAGNSQYYATYSKCVVERTGSPAFKDDAPAAGKYLNSLDVATNNDLYSGSGNSSCLPSASTIIPLTTTKATLKTMITNFVANGNTAGHLGTAWAWYLLSPNWNTIWPADSRPAAYGTTNLKKIAILMTDGEYNKEYYSSQNGDSTSQARTLCTNMKKNTSSSDPNIEIYTVGFDLGGNATAIQTLTQCATDSSHFYNTSTGDELKQAFRDIALKISTLRLTN